MEFPNLKDPFKYSINLSIKIGGVLWTADSLSLQHGKQQSNSELGKSC